MALIVIPKMSMIAASMGALLALVPVTPPASPALHENAPQPELAVIVNPKNPVADLKLEALKAYLKLDRRFWSDKANTPCQVLLRPSRSTEMGILLERVYGWSNERLRKHWVGKVFRGDISRKPSVAPTAAAAAARVRAKTGAITVVLASDLPLEGVRVLTIDKKSPGDEGYALVQARKRKSRLSE